MGEESEEAPSTQEAAAVPDDRDCREDFDQPSAAASRELLKDSRGAEETSLDLLEVAEGRADEIMSAAAADWFEGGDDQWIFAGDEGKDGHFSIATPPASPRGTTKFS